MLLLVVLLYLCRALVYLYQDYQKLTRLALKFILLPFFVNEFFAMDDFAISVSRLEGRIRIRVKGKPTRILNPATNYRKCKVYTLFLFRLESYLSDIDEVMAKSDQFQEKK